MEKRETLIEFLDRTFDERIERLERITRQDKEEAIEALKNGKNDSFKTIDILRGDLDRTVLNSDWLDKNANRLLGLEEFRFTKRINVLKVPAYLADENDKTLSPIVDQEIGNRRPMTKAVTALTYMMNNQMDTHYFPEVVNLYAISSTPKIYDKNQVDEILKERNKVHVLPPVVDNIFLLPTHEIRFLWNPEEVQDMLATHPKEVYDNWKADILKQVESAIDNYQTTFPYRKNYLIRGTNLSRNSLVENNF